MGTLEAIWVPASESIAGPAGIREESQAGPGFWYQPEDFLRPVGKELLCPGGKGQAADAVSAFASWCMSGVQG